ncbi:MAG: discoidin domain-containing protein [Bacillota bacterium]|nr:discoidin domain-containing protein [Bacillota bacterium]
MKKLLSILLALSLSISLMAVSALADSSTLTYDSTWKVAASSEKVPVSRAFDGDTTTYWHTNYTAEGTTVVSHDEVPHTITVTFPSEVTVSGWKYLPRQDKNASGMILEYNIYGSSDGTSFTKVFTGSFSYGETNGDRTEKSATWNGVKVKAIKIEATKTVAGYGTAAEINFIGSAGVASVATTATPATTTATPAATTTTPATPAKSNYVDRTGWTATVNSQIAPIERILDGDNNTYWHSHYTAEAGVVTGQDKPPYDIIVTLPNVTTVSGLAFLPRQDTSHGLIMTAEIYAADSDTGEWTLIAKEQFVDNRYEKTIDFLCNIKVKKILFKVLTSQSSYGTMAEFNLLPQNSEYPVKTFVEAREYKDSKRLYTMDKSGFTASYDNAVWASHAPSFVLDSGTDTFWQSETGIAAPYNLIINFNRECNIAGYSYLPRQSSDKNGVWLTYNVWISQDGTNYKEVLENERSQCSIELNEVYFDKPVTARYMKFEIIDGYTGRASCAELNFYQTKADRDALAAANNEKYVLKIGSKDITFEKGGKTGTVTIDVAPYIENGSTLIPLRGLLEQMGAEITWSGEDQSIGIKNGNVSMKLQIWNKFVYVEDPRYGSVRYTLRATPIITQSRTFVPLRLISEQFGYDVAWDGNTQTITISKTVKG